MTKKGGNAPFPWTWELSEEIKSLWMAGHTMEYLAEQTGINRSTIQNKLRNMNLLGIGRPALPRKRPSPIVPGMCDSWDEKVFESWADRKARLARERAA